MSFKPIPADLAINLYEALISARRLQLHPALGQAVDAVGVVVVDAELQRLVPLAALNHVASLGVRGERVFPVPSIIQCSPALIGYYRMLLGLSRKEFGQAHRLGYQRWVSAEESGTLSPRLRAEIDQFCSALIAPLVQLSTAMSPFNDRDLSDLALLTLGSTLQGGRNNAIGLRAAQGVFQAVTSLIAAWKTLDTPSLVRFRAPPGQDYDLVLGADPDIGIARGSGSGAIPLIAIEIKGGSDASNAHNRAGEAEKSHLKARRMGYGHRWTVMRMRGIDRVRLRSETPSSTELYEIDDILQRRGADWDSFRGTLGAVIGLPL